MTIPFNPLRISHNLFQKRSLSLLTGGLATGSLAITPLLGLASPTSLSPAAVNITTIAPVAQTPERFPPQVACRRPLPLQPVGGNDPEVIKRISLPSLLVSRSNWNTDFIVPTEINFTSFRVNLFFKDSGTYNVKAFLKYGDDSNDRFYDQKVVTEANELVQMQAFPRRRSTNRVLQPFQVNTLVGNVGTVGNVYVVSVDGCR
ncbi:MAG: hypothetical protein AAGA67_08220 [Cyanobacteria bacterium P01_F01_bin.153]